MAVLFPDMFLLFLTLYNRKANNLCERANFIPLKYFAHSSCNNCNKKFITKLLKTVVFSPLDAK